MNVHTLASLALDEDWGPGDLTTESCIGLEVPGEALIRARKDLVVSGHRFAAAIFAEVGRRLGVSVEYEVLATDGAEVRRGAEVARHAVAEDPLPQRAEAPSAGRGASLGASAARSGELRRLR